MTDCNCCWCCKYAHGSKCDDWCNSSERLVGCDCKEEDYRPLIEKRANDVPH